MSYFYKRFSSGLPDAWVTVVTEARAIKVQPKVGQPASPNDEDLENGLRNGEKLEET
jgi:hypothetical protein